MNRWPKSTPDYQWPEQFQGRRWGLPRALLAGLFHASYAIGRALRPLKRNLPPVLVIRTDGIGDALLLEPALESLARIVSPRELHFWGTPLQTSVLKECPAVRKRLSIPGGFKAGNLRYFRSPFWRAKMGFMLGFSEFDLVVYPAESPEPMGNWIFGAVNSVERWINGGDLNNQFEAQRNEAHARATRIFEPRPGAAHELMRNDYLASQWDEGLPLRKPRVNIGDRHATKAAKIVAQWRVEMRRAAGEKLIGLMPAGSSPVNRYPSWAWAEVVKKLWDEERAMAVILGGPSDGEIIRDVTKEIERIAPGTPFLSIPKFGKPVLTMAGIVGRLDMLLSVDTGLAHMSVAQETPTVVLSAGGTPNRFFPWPHAPHHAVLNHSMPCEGCRNRCSLHEPECITRITPDDILNAAVSLLRRQANKTDVNIVLPLHDAPSIFRTRAAG